MPIIKRCGSGYATSFGFVRLLRALQRDEIEFFYFHPTFDDDNGERVFTYCRTNGQPLGAAAQVIPVANCGPSNYADLGFELPWPWADHGKECAAALRARPAWLNVANGKVRIPLLSFDVRVFTT